MEYIAQQRKPDQLLTNERDYKYKLDFLITNLLTLGPVQLF